MALQTAEHNILIVDDEPNVRHVFSLFLENENFSCQTAAGGEEALELLQQEPFSLVVTDVNMPGITGIDLLREIRRQYEDLAVIMASAIDDRKVAVQALEMGAYAYVIKPVSCNELLINVFNALRWRYLELANKEQNEKLEELVLHRTLKLEEAKQELAVASEQTVLRLAKAAEFRDDETAQHTLRMSHYCMIIAKGLGYEKKQSELIRLASQLHDVGKIGISDAILLKPGRLTPNEFALMKEHPLFGYRILSDSKAALLQVGAVIARGHHEKYDGSGYPDGLIGEKIPIEARIASVADVFDALTSRRVYKEAMSVVSAVEILRQGKGNHFDPELVNIFLANMEDVLHVRERFRDPDD